MTPSRTAFVDAIRPRWFCAQNDFIASPLQGGWKDLLDCLCAAPTSKLRYTDVQPPRSVAAVPLETGTVRSGPKAQNMHMLHGCVFYQLSVGGTVNMAVSRAMDGEGRSREAWLLSRSPSRPECGCGSWMAVMYTQLHIVYYRLGKCSLSTSPPTCSLQVVGQAGREWLNLCSGFMQSAKQVSHGPRRTVVDGG